MLRITGRGDEADQAALAWMYAGGKKTEDEEKETAEDFLLGKKFEGKVEDQSDAMKTTQEGFVGGLMEQAKSVNERNEEVNICPEYIYIYICSRAKRGCVGELLNI